MRIFTALATLTLIGATGANAGIGTLKPNAAAPEEVQQFGQLVGSWQCTGENLQQDGTWQESPGVSTWEWYYVLDGYAVQDVWLPDTEANPNASQGTNLRTFDPETGIWDVVWTTQNVPTIEKYRAAYRNDEAHIHAERPATKVFPSHLMHITFHNISDGHFDWKYEASGLTDGQNWQEQARLSCDRVGAGGVNEEVG